MTILEQISHEIMVFMRGKYRLDEIGDGKDELKFKQGTKTILTIYIHEDRFTFLIILTNIIVGDTMKELLWQLFVNTGKIEYYLKYKECLKGEVDGKRYNCR